MQVFVRGLHHLANMAAYWADELLPKDLTSIFNIIIFLHLHQVATLAPHVGQICDQCKWHYIVAEFAIHEIIQVIHSSMLLAMFLRIMGCWSSGANYQQTRHCCEFWPGQYNWGLEEAPGVYSLWSSLTLEFHCWPRGNLNSELGPKIKISSLICGLDTGR